MLLCKIMLEEAEDVNGLLASKLALKYSTGGDASELEAMKAVAKANTNRSIEEFAQAWELCVPPSLRQVALVPERVSSTRLSLARLKVPPSQLAVLCWDKANSAMQRRLQPGLVRSGGVA
jgi:hypothetical protein